ncbi:hypothetical protein PTKIN_Ptkin14bG0122600 [Pterospermum kingtungense]
MANSQAQSTRLTSKSQEASLKACRSSNDRISSLPDALIHRILSLLSTKQAVATSVLSKRWVSLWTLVPTLDLEDSYRCSVNEQDKVKFMHFVYKVLLLNKAGYVEKFRLNCNSYYDYSCVNTWICSAVLRGLQEVDISVFGTPKAYLLKLPSSLFLMKTLKILKLHGGFVVDVPVSVYCPSLKILHLLWVSYANDESISRFISGCMSLEELRIEAEISPENTVFISSPTLNSLSLNLESYRFRIKIDINAPALKYLNFKCRSFFKARLFNVENFPCLIEANIYELFGSCTQLLRPLSAAKYLKLDGHLVSLAWNASSLFVNLTQLELSGFLRWPLVSFFLQKSPKLETVVVHEETFYGKWTQPEEVPTCFFSSLSRACFENFEGLEDELKMVEYFLKNARVLRTMEIYTSMVLIAKPFDGQLMCLLTHLIIEDFRNLYDVSDAYSYNFSCVGADNVPLLDSLFFWM